MSEKTDDLEHRPVKVHLERFSEQFILLQVYYCFIKIPVANKSLELVREGTTMGQIPQNVSYYKINKYYLIHNINY